MDKVLISGLKRENFQAVIQGKETDLFVLTNTNGMEVCITNYGGAIMAIMVPDKAGKMANVIQGHDSIQNMVNSPEPGCQQRPEPSAWRSYGFPCPCVGRRANQRARTGAPLHLCLL